MSNRKLLQSPKINPFDGLNRSSSKRSISSPKVGMMTTNLMSKTYQQRERQSVNGGGSMMSTAPYLNLDQDYSLPSDIENELKTKHENL